MARVLRKNQSLQLAEQITRLLAIARQIRQTAAEMAMLDALVR